MSAGAARHQRFWTRYVLPLCRVALITPLVAFGWQLAMAQSSPPGGQRLIHETWTFKDGAPEFVRDFAQTADGHLWIGTPTGLFLFDGLRFELFRSPFGDQLQSTNLSGLFAPRTGGLWVGYLFGGFSFIKDGKVTNYPEVTGPTLCFAQDKNGIAWAATRDGTARGGLWRFDGSSWHRIGAEWKIPETSFAEVGFDRDGTLWALTDSPGIDDPKQLFFLSPGQVHFQKAGDHLTVQGFTWDADYTVLTSRERRSHGSGSGIELESSLPAYPILKKHSEQFLDRAESIWFIPTDPFILRHPAGGPLAETIDAASRDNSEVYQINPGRFARLVDREGSLWIADFRDIHRFSYSPLVQQDIPMQQSLLLTLIPDEGGVVWISAGDAQGASTLYRVAKGKAEIQSMQVGGSAFAYRAPDKTFWLGGEGGLSHIVNGRITRIELPPDTVARDLTTIIQDRSGAMWVSFGLVGLYRFNDGVWTKHGGRSDLSISAVLAEFTDSLGRVWFGATKNQLAVLDGDRVQTFVSADGVQVGNVTAIYGRGQEIWVGGEFGLQQFDHGRFHTIHAVDNDSLRGISGIVERPDGDLWLNGLGGIVHIRRAELLEALKNPNYRISSERFDRRAGLPGLPSQSRRLPTALEGTDGRLWFTVNNGVVWLDPSRASNKVPPPPVSIESISADDKSFAVGHAAEFPARTYNVQINYDAISLLNPEAIHFRYKLNETEEDWHEAGISKSVNYRSLPPGSYHFVVEASDTNGLWSGNTATVEFTILPAFYQTRWFRSLCVAAFLGLLWAAHQFRVRQLHRQFEMTLDARVGERTRIARDLHDTLLQSAHGLLLRFQVVSFLLPERPKEAKEKLDSAIEYTSEFIGEARDQVQGLRASAAESNDLARTISMLGEELAMAVAEKRPSFHVAVEGEPRELHPIVRDEIYKIAAEALRNAFQHAHAKRVEVELHYDDAQFRLHVRDDGKGMDAAVLANGAEGHYGLPGMRERAGVIGGKLTLWSALDAGTEMELRVSAPAAYSTQRGSWLARKFANKA